MKLSLMLLASLLVLSCSCARRQASSDEVAALPEVSARVAPGVEYRAIAGTDPLAHGSPVWVVEADLTVPGVGIGVACSGLRERESPRYGEAKTAAEWCAATGAVAAVNGGYFGEGDDARKEIVGLLVADGAVVSSGGVRRGDNGPYVRSVLGIDASGRPSIRWATGTRGRTARLMTYAGPEGARRLGRWPVREAVGCGPTLVHNGTVRVMDREERLVSGGRLPRTFIAYSTRSGRPHRFVLGVAQAMEYADVARFIAGYFDQRYGTPCHAAMCLDGGGSSQLAYAMPDGLQEPAPSPVTVPTAVIVRARR